MSLAEIPAAQPSTPTPHSPSLAPCAVHLSDDDEEDDEDDTEEVEVVAPEAAHIRPRAISFSSFLSRRLMLDLSDFSLHDIETDDEDVSDAPQDSQPPRVLKPRPSNKKNKQKKFTNHAIAATSSVWYAIRPSGQVPSPTLCLRPALRLPTCLCLVHSRSAGWPRRGLFFT